MTADEKIEFLQGQVQALQACILALIETHPDPAGFCAKLAGMMQASLAKGSGDGAADAAIDGFQDMQTSLEKYAASALARRQRARP